MPGTSNKVINWLLRVTSNIYHLSDAETTSHIICKHVHKQFRVWDLAHCLTVLKGSRCNDKNVLIYIRIFSKQSNRWNNYHTIASEKSPEKPQWFACLETANNFKRRGKWRKVSTVNCPCSITSQKCIANMEVNLHAFWISVLERVEWSAFCADSFAVWKPIVGPETSMHGETKLNSALVVNWALVPHSVCLVTSPTDLCCK